MKYKNTLWQYHGGGYDGCIWEWNFFIIDSEGKFKSLYASGRDGITNRDLDSPTELVEWLNEFTNESHVYHYDLDSRKDCTEFITENNEQNVFNTFTQLEKITTEYTKWYIECSKCGISHDPDDYIATEYHGDGGIGVINTGYICTDCYSAGSCMHCGEYQGEDELNSGYCSDCYEAIIEKAMKDNIYLDFDPEKNTFYEGDKDDIDFSDLVDSGENWYLVDINASEGITTYLINSNNEAEAINFVAIYLDNNYYTAKANTVNEFMYELV